MSYHTKNKRWTIKANINTPTSIMEGTLSHSGQFCIATNEPRRFDSLLSARIFFWTSSTPPKCNVWIQGPRGGRYSVGSRHNLGL